MLCRFGVRGAKHCPGVGGWEAPHPQTTAHCFALAPPTAGLALHSANRNHKALLSTLHPKSTWHIFAIPSHRGLLCILQPLSIGYHFLRHCSVPHIPAQGTALHLAAASHRALLCTFAPAYHRALLRASPAPTITMKQASGSTKQRQAPKTVENCCKRAFSDHLAFGIVDNFEHHWSHLIWSIFFFTAVGLDKDSNRPIVSCSGLKTPLPVLTTIPL